MTAQLFAYVSYRDARAALDWLAALGFSEVRRLDFPNNPLNLIFEAKA